MEEPKKEFNKVFNIILVIIAGVLIVIASSAFWFNNYLFNTGNFTATATEAINSDSSRNAILTEIVERALKDKPVLQNVVGERATKLVSGLLETNLAQNSLEKTVTRLHSIVVSKNPENVELDLTPLKDTVVKITNILEATGATAGNQINSGNVPDKIVILDAHSLPNIYSYGVAVLWLGPLAALTAVVLLFFPIYRHWKNPHILTWLLSFQGAGIIFFAGVALVLGPLFRPLILGPINNPNLQMVAGNIYDSFIEKFNEQTLLIFIIGIIFLVFAFSNYWFRVRKS